MEAESSPPAAASSIITPFLKRRVLFFANSRSSNQNLVLSERQSMEAKQVLHTSSRWLGSERNAFYDNAWDDGNSLGPKEVHNFLTGVMHDKWNKFNALCNSLVLRGVKNGEKYLGMVSMMGEKSECNYVAIETGNHLALPILRNEWNENLSFEDGVKLLEKCMLVILYYESSAVNRLQIAKITAEGPTIFPPYSLKTFWGYEAYRNPTVGAEGSW